MDTIKSFTDIEQSRKLVKILPFESADMYRVFENNAETRVYYGRASTAYFVCESCWSLAALLKYLKEIKPQVYTPILFPSEGKWILQFVEYGHGDVCEVSCDNPIDACVTMIEKLHKLKML